MSRCPPLLLLSVRETMVLCDEHGPRTVQVELFCTESKGLNYSALKAFKATENRRTTWHCLDVDGERLYSSLNCKAAAT